MKPQIMINKYLYSIIVATLCFTSIIAQNEIQRVRVNLTTPTGYVRQLLLGFTPDNAATDAVDFGYDAANPDNFANDFGWVIENQSYVIQGVGSFSTDKVYPIGAFLENSGIINIDLHSLENFNQTIDVYIYDTITNEYDKLNEVNCSKSLNSGNYYNRFFITFKNDHPQSMWQDLLSVENQLIENFNISYNKSTSSISVIKDSSSDLSNVLIFNASGQEIENIYMTHKKYLSIDTSSLSKGLYFVNINSRLSSVTRKIVVY